MAGTQVDEIDATLLTLKGTSDRPVWSEQFRESAVACQSEPAILASSSPTAMRLKPMGRLAASVARRLGRLHRRRLLTTGHHVYRSTSQDDWCAPLNHPHRWPQGRAQAGAAVSLRCRAAQALGSARALTRFVI